MKETPDFRVVGSATDSQKEEVKKDISSALFDHYNSLSQKEKDDIKKFEYPKSDIELKIIDCVNQITSKLMTDAGVEPYNIPEENLHIIPRDLFRRASSNESTTASTFYTKQGIIFDATYFRDNPVYFGAVALHEILHLKGYFSVEAQDKNGEISKTPYREGVGVMALQKFGLNGYFHEHFIGLHEAIVSETEKRFFRQILELPELAEEKEWLESAEAKDSISKITKNKKLDPEEVIWIDKNTKNKIDIVSYEGPRKVFKYVCEEIYNEFNDKFSSLDDVYKIFLKAHFNGNLLEIGRLVEKAFGEGSFRLLGNMTPDDKSAILHLEALQKARLKKIRESKTK